MSDEVRSKQQSREVSYYLLKENSSFTKFFFDFWLRSECIDLWKITPDFYNTFSDFGGGDVPASPPLPTLLTLNILRFYQNLDNNSFLRQFIDGGGRAEFRRSPTPFWRYCKSILNMRYLELVSHYILLPFTNICYYNHKNWVKISLSNNDHFFFKSRDRISQQLCRCIQNSATALYLHGVLLLTMRQSDLLVFIILRQNLRL